MSGQMMICDHASLCDLPNCIHKQPHTKEHSCDKYCLEDGHHETTCVLVDIPKPKPKRKRSAPLYGELLTERQRLTLENHNMRVCLDLIRNATLFGLIAWWFKQRKGRA